MEKFKKLDLRGTQTLPIYTVCAIVQRDGKETYETVKRMVTVDTITDDNGNVDGRWAIETTNNFYWFDEIAIWATNLKNI